MWTYVMASARGDRAHSMMSSRRRQETDSPIYQYNCTTVTPADTAILIGRKHLLANRNNTSTNITTRNCMENPAAVVRLTSSNSQALLQPDYNADDNSEQILQYNSNFVAIFVLSNYDSTYDSELSQ
ncbi:hypothetical protein GQX74_014053 [Glossina fuscipes]|nr:hypothetical protein GQX74_014053 [Glossina fuscipes]